MLCSHIRNFTIKRALAMTFASVSNGGCQILVTPSSVANDEIYAKKLLKFPDLRQRQEIKRERSKKER